MRLHVILCLLLVLATECRAQSAPPGGLEPWEAFQAVKEATGARYVRLRDELLREPNLAERLKARRASKDWRTALTARVLQGWLDHAQVYRKFLADMDSVDIENERRSVAGVARVWDGFARLARTKLKLRALPLAWEIVLKRSDDWAAWKVITALKILWVVPHKLSVDPVLWVIDSNQNLRDVAARTLAHLPREAVRKQVVAAKARHEAIAGALGDALEEMDD